VQVSLKLILFDLDDTLFDFQTTWDAVLKEMLAEHALTCDEDTKACFARFKKIGEETYVLYEQRTYTLEQYRNLRIIQTVESFGKQMADEEATAFNLDFIQRYLESLQPRPEVLDVLQRLNERYVMGIVTNGPHDMQEGKIQRLGLREFFPPERVWISYEVGFAKPDPRIYQLAMDHFQVSPEEAVFVGDSWESDVVGPLQAGLQAVWLKRPGREPKSNHLPIAVITDLNELIDLLL
jgi:5'-nucleotidase